MYLHSKISEPEIAGGNNNSVVDCNELYFKVIRKIWLTAVV